MRQHGISDRLALAMPPFRRALILLGVHEDNRPPGIEEFATDFRKYGYIISVNGNSLKSVIEGKDIQITLDSDCTPLWIQLCSLFITELYVCGDIKRNLFVLMMAAESGFKMNLIEDCLKCTEDIHDKEVVELYPNVLSGTDALAHLGSARGETRYSRRQHKM